MNNEEILNTNNEQLIDNNEILTTLLELINKLPEAGSIPTKLSQLVDDLGTNPTHTHENKQNKVLYGTEEPTSEIGSEGDIYIKYM
jgi:uncharacterized protein YjgD (DUF1641 family)